MAARTPSAALLEPLAAAHPQLYAVDYVLPEYVAARPYGGERRQVCGGYPDGEGRVLLPEGLSGVDRRAESRVQKR